MEHDDTLNGQVVIAELDGHAALGWLETHTEQDAGRRVLMLFCDLGVSRPIGPGQIVKRLGPAQDYWNSGIQGWHQLIEIRAAERRVEIPVPVSMRIIEMLRGTCGVPVPAQARLAEIRALYPRGADEIPVTDAARAHADFLIEQAVRDFVFTRDAFLRVNAVPAPIPGVRPANARLH